MTNYKKQAVEAFERWSNSNLDNLYKAYARPSMNKYSAWEECLNLMREKCGWGLRIISYNTYVFTAGFVYEDDDGQTKFYYITPSHETTVDVTGMAVKLL